MLPLYIKGGELWNEETNRFKEVKGQEIVLEHSLVSLAKWEAKWHIPFIGNKGMTYEQTVDYVKLMTLTKNVPDELYDFLSAENFKAINDYIENPMTATTFNNETKRGRGREVITNEVIYSWMIALKIPMECQRWHLNHLITLIKVCSINNTPKKKMSQNEIFNQNRELNAARREANKLKG